MPPQQQQSTRSEQKRDQIRNGARRVFLDSGFAGSTMDQVAATAGVSKQTLYAYYRSKEDLLVDVLGNEVEILDEQATALWDCDVGTVAALRNSLIDIAVAFTTIAMRPKYLTLVRMLISEIPTVPGLGPLWREAVPARGMARLSGVLARAQQAGTIGEVDLDLATRMLIGPMLTFVLLDGLTRPGKVHRPTRAQLERLVDLYLRAVT